MSETIKGLLKNLTLPPADLAMAHKRLPEVVKKENNGQEVAALSLQLDQISARLDRLTDMHLDGLIDGEGFQNKKAILLVEQRRIEEQIEVAGLSAVDEANVRRFLELTTNLAGLYDSATKHEKRRIVEWATLNRTATGKSVCFEPSNWLTGTKALLAALYCAHKQDNSRTFDLKVLRSLEQLEIGKAVKSSAYSKNRRNLTGS
ncbi:hypothetical protein [Qipengyuania sp. ASV99]|uniref:hypothetical protein n=1 Tax=Qipengyuania sp. ASV99 TaxID=3399681 RepID=UPI003A4C71EC